MLLQTSTYMYICGIFRLYMCSVVTMAPETSLEPMYVVVVSMYMPRIVMLCDASDVTCYVDMYMQL